MTWAATQASMVQPIPGRQRPGMPRIPLVVILFWSGFWAAIGTGIWSITAPEPGIVGLSNMARALYPPMMMIFGLMVMLLRTQRQRLSPIETAMIVYGLLGLLAALPNERWTGQAYFGSAFLAVVFFVSLAHQSGRGEQVYKALNIASWLAGCALLAVMLVLSRDALFDADVSSGYGVVTRVAASQDILVSRSSGLARLAAIPAIIALLLFWQLRSVVLRIAAASVFAGAAYLVYFMQSRGSFFGFAFALLFALIYGRQRGNGPITLLLIVLGMATISMFANIDAIWDHITRSSGVDGLYVMSGRPLIWQDCLALILKQPVLGYGFQADRVFLDVNAQNAYVYAALAAGIPGALAFTYASFRPLLSVARLGRHLPRLDPGDQLIVRIASAILVFSLIRSLPENQAAVFSVDLLIQYPAMLYLFAMEHKASALRAQDS